MAAGNIYHAHVNGEPHQVHTGAAGIESWVIVNRDRNVGYLFVWNDVIANITPGETAPNFIIPVADKDSFSPNTVVEFGSAIAIGFFLDRDGTVAGDSDVWIEYTT